MSSFLERARAVVVRATGDKFHVSEEILLAFAKEMENIVNEEADKLLQAAADKLAEEAESYLGYGHAISNEDAPLQKAIDDYRNLRQPRVDGSSSSPR